MNLPSSIAVWPKESLVIPYSILSTRNIFSSVMLNRIGFLVICPPESFCKLLVTDAFKKYKKALLAMQRSNQPKVHDRKTSIMIFSGVLQFTGYRYIVSSIWFSPLYVYVVISLSLSLLKSTPKIR